MSGRLFTMCTFGANRRATVLAALLALLGGALAGCSVFSAPDREYQSNARVLSAIEAKIHYRVDRSAFRLTHAEVTEDAITLHYLGVEHPGDQAWVVRFSEKSTELAPDRLATVAPAISVIRDGELLPGFTPNLVSSLEIAGVALEAATYTFDSTLAPSGRTGRGVLAAVRRTERGRSVIYQIKLDNHGDRERLTPAALTPLIAAIAPRENSP